MPNLEAQAAWVPVREIGIELARGGPNGNMNEQAKALLARTEYLNQEKASKSEIVQGHYEFNTYAEFNAIKSTLPLNCTVIINEMPTGTQTWGQGTNRWNGTSLTKSPHDPLTQAKVYTDTSLSSVKIFEQFQARSAKNLIDLSKLQHGRYINASGALMYAAGWGATNFIPVTAGQQYTISGNFGYCAVAVYPSKTAVAAGDVLFYAYAQPLLPYTFTIPAGGAYAVVNIYSASAPNYSKIQLEQGAVATTYVSGTDTNLIKKELILGIDDPKPYEQIVAGSFKNLFKATKVQANKYISTDGRWRTAAGWGTSGFIPVVAGQQYTISGNFGYTGIAFYSSTASANALEAPLLFESAPVSMPKTVTAPAGATVLVINLYQPTSPSFSNVQVELGSTATAYENGDDKVYLKDDYLQSKAAQGGVVASKSEAKFTSGNLLTVTASDGVNTHEHQMQIVKSATVLTSMVANFTKDAMDGVTVGTMNDDAAPARLDTATVGANHGYSKSILTANAHGKTAADIGSTWVSQDGGDCVLIDVVNANTLYITRKDSNAALNSAQLIFTHKSGATNTATINATVNTASQWYPSIKKLSHRCFVDGSKVELGKDVTLSFNDDVVVSETYEILSRASMIHQHIDNIGTRLASYENAQSVMSVTNNYRFDKYGGITIEAEYVVLAPMTLDDLMMIQSIKRSWSGNTSYYVPKVKPIVAGGTTYDFENIVNISGGLAGNAIFTPSDVKDGENAPDRGIQLSNDYGFALGYLPVLDADYTAKKLNATVWHMYIPSSSLKVYPYLISKGSHAVDVGTSYACVAYRQYFKRKVGETAVYPVYSRFGDYLYMHWHSAGLKRVELPESLMGRAFTISEKSPNVTLISKVAGSIITANIADSASAYLVLKFD